jgi:hypothetical protein
MKYLVQHLQPTKLPHRQNSSPLEPMTSHYDIWLSRDDIASFLPVYLKENLKG